MTAIERIEGSYEGQNAQFGQAYKRRPEKRRRLPGSSEDLVFAAQDNGAPPSFVGLLGLLPAAVEFQGPDEVVEQLGRIQGLG